MVSVIRKALLGTLVVILLGLAVFGAFSFVRFQENTVRLQGLQTQLDQSKVVQFFFETFHEDEGFCDSFLSILDSVSQKTFDLGFRLEALEQAEDFSSEVIDLKRQYMIQEANLWLYVVNIRKTCVDSNVNTVVYFYTNSPGACLDCKTQGFVLDELKKKYGDSLWVFSFETNYQTEIVDIMRQQFKVVELPAVVINEKKTLVGLSSRLELENALAQTAG